MLSAGGGGTTVQSDAAALVPHCAGDFMTTTVKASPHNGSASGRAYGNMTRPGWPPANMIASSSAPPFIYQQGQLLSPSPSSFYHQQPTTTSYAQQPATSQMQTMGVQPMMMMMPPQSSSMQQQPGGKLSPLSSQVFPSSSPSYGMSNQSFVSAHFQPQQQQRIETSFSHMQQQQQQGLSPVQRQQQPLSSMAQQQQPLSSMAQQQQPLSSMAQQFWPTNAAAAAGGGGGAPIFSSAGSTLSQQLLSSLRQQTSQQTAQPQMQPMSWQQQNQPGQPSLPPTMYPQAYPAGLSNHTQQSLPALSGYADHQPSAFSRMPQSNPKPSDQAIQMQQQQQRAEGRGAMPLQTAASYLQTQVQPAQPSQQEHDQQRGSITPTTTVNDSKKLGALIGESQIAGGHGETGGAVTPSAANAAATKWLVPNVKLVVRGQHTTLHEALMDKRGLIFGFPGAFAPLCTESHLPGIRDSISYLRKGVDYIACVTVNDPYVLKAWAKDLCVPPDVVMISDWEGKLTRALGFELDATAYHMGTRSRRFAVLVNKGVLMWFGLEDDAFADQVGVVLHHLGWISSSELDNIAKVCAQYKKELVPPPGSAAHATTNSSGGGGGGTQQKQATATQHQQSQPASASRQANGQQAPQQAANKQQTQRTPVLQEQLAASRQTESTAAARAERKLQRHLHQKSHQLVEPQGAMVTSHIDHQAVVDGRDVDDGEVSEDEMGVGAEGNPRRDEADGGYIEDDEVDDDEEDEDDEDEDLYDHELDDGDMVGTTSQSGLMGSSHRNQPPPIQENEDEDEEEEEDDQLDAEDDEEEDDEDEEDEEEEDTEGNQFDGEEGGLEAQIDVVDSQWIPQGPSYNSNNPRQQQKQTGRMEQGEASSSPAAGAYAGQPIGQEDCFA